LTIYLKLVKAGYGDLEAIKRMTSREVIQALYYEEFLINYENVYMELNK